MNECPIVDGALPNRNQCSCLNGETCTPATGLICDATTRLCSNGDCGSNAMTTETVPNCLKFTPRCRCAQCKAGFCSADCFSICPESSTVSIVLDVFYLSICSWYFLSYLYYTHRRVDIKTIQELRNTMQKNTKKSGSVTESVSHVSNTKVSKEMTQNINSLQRLIVSRMQVIASIFASIMWSPKVPQFLIDILTFITSIFTVNIPGLLTSMDCVPVEADGTGLSPLRKWYLGLLLPILVLAIFPLWRSCLAKNSVARNAVDESGVQVYFVWLFELIVTSSLRALDCTGGLTGKFMIDPTLPCPLSDRSTSGPAVLGIIILVIYVVLPYVYFFWNQPFFFCCGCPCRGIDFDYSNSKDSKLFSSIFSWSLKDYRKEVRGYEIWSVINRTLVIVGCTIMYPGWRFVLHIIVMLWSLFLHYSLNPYKCKETSKAAYLFLVCDILGAVCSIGQEGWVLALLQILFLVLSLFTVLTIAGYVTKNLRKQASVVRTGMSNRDTDTMFATYTSLEKKFLFPVLSIVWIFVKVYRKYRKFKGHSDIENIENINEHNTKITPRNEMEMKTVDQSKQVDQSIDTSISIADDLVDQSKQINQSIDTSISIADDLLESFDVNQKLLAKQHDHNKRRSVVQLQHRLRARQRIKDTKALKNVPVFAGLTPEATQNIVNKMEYCKFSANVPIVKQGDIANHLFIVVSGQCCVEINSNNISKRVGTLHALDFFGENALLDYKNDNRTRNATVTSENNTVQLLSLSTEDFIDLFNSKILDEKVIERMQTATIKRNIINEAKIHEKIEIPIPSTSTVSRFDLDRQKTTMDPTKLMEGHETMDTQLKKQISYQRKTSVNRTQMRLLARQRIKQTGAFAKIPMFQSLGKEQIETLINAMNFKIYPEASSLCVQGDVADCLFILISGQCKVTTRQIDSNDNGNGNDTKERRVATRYELDILGEHALVGSANEPRLRTATVTAELGTAQVLELRREKFEEIISSMDAAMIPDGFMKHMEDLAEKRRI